MLNAFAKRAAHAAASAALLLMGVFAVQAAQFTPGNLVVYRVGDGSAALGPSSTVVFLDEFSPAGGAPVQSLALPTAANGLNAPLTSSGSATSEGLLNRSVDGKYLLATGYSAAPGVASIAGTTSAANPRVIGRIDGAGTIDTTTALTDASTAASPRSAISTNGTDLWITGGAGGIRYTTLGSTTSTQISTTQTNLRAVDIVESQLYVSTASGTLRLATVGTGTPTTAGQTITNLPGFPTATATPYQFVFADLSGSVAGVDTVYVADDTAGQVQKYSLVGGNWTPNGSIALTNVRGLTGVTGAAAPIETLYATNGTTLSSIVDATGYNAAPVATATTLATAGANTAFRGLDFAPGAVPEPTAIGLLGLGGLLALRRRR